MLHKYNPFQLVCRGKVVVLAKFILPSLYIDRATQMMGDESLSSRIYELQQLEKYRFLVEFHQKVDKECQKAWDDRHIKSKYFQVGDYVLLYDSKYLKHPRKLQMHWLGPFLVAYI